MAFALATVGMIYCIGMVVLLPFKRTRKFAFRTGLLAAIVTIPAMIIGGVQLNEDAQKAGFRNLEDKANAEKAGIADAKIWNERRVDFLSKWSAEERQKEADAKRTQADQQRNSDAACKADFNCWTNKFQHAATNACSPRIERLAKNNFEWTDSFTSPKFPRAVIAPNGEMITYAGDKMKMQNAFTAWTIVTYECDFDTQSGIAVAVRANPGQLSN
ncbi:hypothetical protein [Rhizobium lusitanum]|uniref:hypothetical protein n=1 Tax=Rhizobium lusitanum TaxID=293958 RepID=UPI001957F6E6|nr:hypothetical protein [Rhizobium lusitanum]MBM7048372.1 hypothetical protein [Rhizobium lusitanum]